VALEARKLFIDVQARQFVVSPDSSLPSFDPLWFEEDVEAIELYALRPTLNPAAPYEYLDLSGSTVKFAVGVTAPAALQTSWTPIATAVTAAVTTLVAGSTGTAEQQRVVFSGAIPAQGGFAIQLPSRSVSVSSVSAGVFVAPAHGFCDNQVVTLTGFTISAGSFANATYFVVESTDSTFRIAPSLGGAAVVAALATSTGTANIDAITTGQIAYNATASDVQAAFVSAGINVNNTSPISVTGTPRREFVFVYGGRMSNRDYAPLVLTGSTLLGATGLSANVTFNTVDIAALVTAGVTNVSVEIEISEGAVRQTFRRPATLSGDIITSTVPVPTPANVFTSLLLSSPDSTVFTLTVTNDGELMIAG
jgi:hypothetical protein